MNRLTSNFFTQTIAIFRTFIVLLVIAGLLSTVCHAQKDTAFSDVQDYARRLVDSGKCASIAIGVIDANGEHVFTYGEIEKGNGRKPDTNTLYGIGSITKLFTCSVLADMVESGELSLSDPISKFLPESLRTPICNGKEITLYDLATHTSGLPARPDNLAPANPDQPYADYSEAQLYEYLSRVKLPREIGSRYEYSNIGVGLLGYILAHKSGLEYGALVKKRICEPLGLQSTFIEVPAHFRPTVAQAYNREGQTVRDWTFSPIFAGAGSLKSTVHDMLVFLSYNIGLTQSKLSTAFEATHIKHPGNNIALGWHIWNEHGTTIFGHSGSSIGYRSFIGFIKERKIGVIVLSNRADVVMDIGLHILDDGYKLREY